MQRKQLLMPPLIQQVCRQPDGYSSSAGGGLDERRPHQGLWPCVSVFLTPPPTSVQIGEPLRRFHQGPALMEFPTSSARSHSTREPSGNSGRRSLGAKSKCKKWFRRGRVGAVGAAWAAAENGFQSAPFEVYIINAHQAK